MYFIDICVIFKPRISGSRAISVARKLSSANFHLEEAFEFLEGIWIGWNGRLISLEIVLSTKQAVSAIISDNDKHLGPYCYLW